MIPCTCCLISGGLSKTQKLTTWAGVSLHFLLLQSSMFEPPFHLIYFFRCTGSVWMQRRRSGRRDDQDSFDRIGPTPKRGNTFKEDVWIKTNLNLRHLLGLKGQEINQLSLTLSHVKTQPSQALLNVDVNFRHCQMNTLTVQAKVLREFILL